ncbi:hypothetical protein J7E96_22885 [Streptomyces sp. ISL-96]|uniref:hypothetical protein n=1 Tax=Streptomyces sp. ISL-96 TaxID=2819191 RepID=UPI001BE9209E|nr:hypothetical protein [Streptomyces sp. ISL-96]MBT2491315.1 hypothetical protein [Streptomyces sp. ISL-96]
MNPAAVRELLPWLPPTHTIWSIPAGVHWDAVRAPRSVGAIAIRELGDACGPVICDPWTRFVYVLTNTGSTTNWDVRETMAYWPTTYVEVPPLGAEEHQLHWAVEPTGPGHLTDVELLRTALGTAVDSAFGPRTEHVG